MHPRFCCGTGRGGGRSVLGTGFFRASLKGARNIEISLSPREVCFREGEAVLSLRPIVILSSESRVVLAVGQKVPSIEPITEIELFNPQSIGTGPYLKYECLKAFFRYAFTRFGTRIVRPRVIVSLSREIANLFCGYEAALLRQALLEVGARECVFATELRRSPPS